MKVDRYSHSFRFVGLPRGFEAVAVGHGGIVACFPSRFRLLVWRTVSGLPFPLLLWASPDNGAKGPMRSPFSSSGLVQLVSRRPRPGERAESQFFTTWRTMEMGQWQSDLVYGLLQFRPSKYYGLRCFAHEFHIAKPVKIARTVARANPQFGPGGGEHVFIPQASHAQALVPMGDLIPLFDSGNQPGPTPKGFIAELIDLETSLGNSLVASDSQETSPARNRFWMQEPLHQAEIRRMLALPQCVQFFEEDEIYGNTRGFVSDEDGQVLISPAMQPEPANRWWNKAWRLVARRK